jgi:hypothetical protein
VRLRRVVESFEKSPIGEDLGPVKSKSFLCYVKTRRSFHRALVNCRRGPFWLRGRFRARRQAATDGSAGCYVISTSRRELATDIRKVLCVVTNVHEIYPDDGGSMFLLSAGNQTARYQKKPVV